MFRLFFILIHFLDGFLVCDLHITRGECKLSFLWDALAVCGWPLVWLLGRNSGHVVLPFVIVLLYFAAFRRRTCSAVFSNRVIINIGGMCYSIYLFHFLIIYAMKRFTAALHIGQNFWVYYVLQATLILPVVLLLCGTFFLLIERPCMNREWPRKLWRWGQGLMLPAARERQAQLPD